MFHLFQSTGKKCIRGMEKMQLECISLLLEENPMILSIGRNTTTYIYRFKKNSELKMLYQKCEKD
jgi:hypothetical protein